MPRDSRLYLQDIQEAAALIVEFTYMKSRSDYESDALIRSAVERQFEIIGEALSKLAQLDTEVVSSISAYRAIIAFRNILAHNYSGIDDGVVWDALEGELPILRAEVAALLSQE